MSEPLEILAETLEFARQRSIAELAIDLSPQVIDDVLTVVNFAETQKAVLAVTLTSLAYKIYKPDQDIRFHQSSMPNGYAGRTFDTNYVTPFLSRHFTRLAMKESGWLTRSLEQPHPYTLKYPGHIQNRKLKQAFLRILDRVQKQAGLAERLLPLVWGLLLQTTAAAETLTPKMQLPVAPSIVEIVNAVQAHIYHPYRTRGASRLPVLAIFAVYQLLLQEVERYKGKSLQELAAHTAADFRAKTMGDIQVLNDDGTVFEAIEIKHAKPITAEMITRAFEKIKAAPLDRYYVLTTNDPNIEHKAQVMERIEELRQIHPCQFVANGVLPSLKYYLRLISHPENFVEGYSRILQNEFAHGRIKSEHLKIWNELQLQFV